MTHASRRRRIRLFNYFPEILCIAIGFSLVFVAFAIGVTR